MADEIINVKSESGKTLLTIGVIIWIGYILYKNNEQDMAMKDLSHRVHALEQSLAQAMTNNIPDDVPGAQQLPTPVIQTSLTPAQNSQMYNDRILGMLPRRSLMNYNASGNATVSPMPTQVTVGG